MNALMTCLAGAVLFVGSIAGGPQRGELRFNQVHHAYIGGVACGLGAAVKSKTLERLGAFLILDDGLQHTYQRMNYPGMGEAALAIRSPVNIGYRLTFGKIVLLSKLNTWLDRLLR